jgi:hypothetical protein
MFAERSSLWSKVELLRRSLEEIAMPGGARKQFPVSPVER